MNYRELCCNSSHGWPRTRTDAATEPNRGHPVHRKLIPAHATLLASPAARGINSGQALKLKQVTSLLPNNLFYPLEKFHIFLSPPTIYSNLNTFMC
jgi:hypothetical protein